MYQSYVYIEARIQLPFSGELFPANPETGKISVNSEVLAKVLTLSKALSCRIPELSDIEHITSAPSIPENSRKFTGYSIKIAESGFMNLSFHSRQKTIKINAVRIEEDRGHLTHANGNNRMDYSSLGAPSIRIITEASFELGEEVQIFLEELRRLSQYLHLTEDSSADKYIRCNAYVSLVQYPEKSSYFIKLRNLNSFNFARKAVNAELTRLENMLSCGEKVTSESRLWNEHKGCTEFYQERENKAQRFEKLNPPQTFNISSAIKDLPAQTEVELPEARRIRFKKEYGVSRLRAEFLCDFKDRADFFEETVRLGAKPLNSAHWIASELTRLLNKKNIPVSESKITAENFAFIIKKLDSGEMHSAAAKTLMRASFESGSSPEKLIKSLNISEIGTEKELLPYVKKVISENPALCNTLKKGEMPPLEFLTGLVMKETRGKAVPQIVKQLIKQELNISVIYVITTGGAISAVRHMDGSISSGDSSIIKEMAKKIEADMPVQVISAGQYLSEELEPSNWALLIQEVQNRINAGTANGIVITHGTYTLSYTAALLFWLFSDSGVPIVLTASSSLPSDSYEAEENLDLALKTAAKEKNGVYVAFGGKILSPLNLHFDKPGSFLNWNLEKPIFTESGPIASQFAGIGELDKNVLSQLLVEASGQMFMFRLYPGLRSDLFKNLLLYTKVKAVFAELYGLGSGNMKNSDFSLKPLLLLGNKKGVKFYCTSQQKMSLDFSQYVTAHDVWREGAVPMGYLTTESAVSLYFACAIVSDSQAEFDELMENYASMYSL
ncbi:MAG: asparaginase domain-containing protein [Treponema sp.]|nr:asparaginase domain-containing protein [Treponema sp.]